MRLLVCGNRDWEDKQIVFDILSALHPCEIIHGHCPTGADAIAHEWALANKIPVCIFPADWSRYGRAAGPIRNQYMINNNPNMVLAFGYGRGTNDCTSRARKANIPVARIRRESR